MDKLNKNRIFILIICCLFMTSMLPSISFADEVPKESSNQLTFYADEWCDGSIHGEYKIEDDDTIMYNSLDALSPDVAFSAPFYIVADSEGKLVNIKEWKINDKPLNEQQLVEIYDYTDDFGYPNYEIRFKDYASVGEVITLTAIDDDGNTAQMKMCLVFSNLNPDKVYKADTNGYVGTGDIIIGTEYYATAYINEWKNLNKHLDNNQTVAEYLKKCITITSSNKDIVDPDDENLTKVTYDELRYGNGNPAVRFYFKTKAAGQTTLEFKFDDDNLNIHKSANVTIVSTGVVLSPLYSRLAEGETVQLKYDVSAVDLDPEDTEWSSSDKSVATVDDNGLVTAVGNGECQITASNQDYSTNATINTWKDGIYIDGEHVTEYEYDASVNPELNLDVRYNGRLYSQDYWYSSNTSIAEITSAIQVDETGHAIDNGIVTFKKDGTVTFYAVRSAPSENFPIMGKCVIKVTGFKENGDNDQKWEIVTEPQGLYDKVRLLNHKVETQLYRDDIYENMITEPVYADNCSFMIEVSSQAKGNTLTDERKENIIKDAMSKIFICELDDDGNPGEVVASYDNKGLELNNAEFDTSARWMTTYDISVKRGKLQRGSSYVLLLTSNFKQSDNAGTIGKRAVYKFDTIPAANKVTISQEEATLNVGETLSLEAKLLGDNPEIAPDDVLIWDTPDDSVTVDQEGNVTAVKPGTAVVTARALYGEVAAQCTITVVGEPADPSDPDNPSGGDSEPSVNPDNPSDDNGNSSDNPSGDNDASNDNPSDDASAKTGDSMNIWMLIALLAVSGAAGAAALRRRAKQ